jgi:hypothetical protein
MAVKTQLMHEGKLYYSVAATARLLGTTTPKLRQLIIPEGLEWANFRINGPIWISAESVASYLRRRQSQGKA